MSQLDEWMKRINEELGRPVAAYTKTEKGLFGNIGHLLISQHSPGDGWTRYAVEVMQNERGGVRSISPRCMRRAELEAFLTGLQTGMELSKTVV